MITIRALAVVLAVVLRTAPGSAQAVPNGRAATADSESTRFVADARAGTARYRDRAVAIADGYHRVGPELPSMGEHWLNIELILADRLDAAHPPVLIYVPSPSGPVLAGAAYTRLLAPTDDYPGFPAGMHAWHAHSGFLDDEALPMSHAMHNEHAAHEPPTGTRLGILHLWMSRDNPAGEWVPDNWALPFVRAGVRPPPIQDDAAARALALAADSGRYYLGVLTAVAKLDSSEVRRVRAVLIVAAAEVRGVRLTPGVPPTPEQLAALRAVWTRLWPQIGSALGPQATSRLSELNQTWW